MRVCFTQTILPLLRRDDSSAYRGSVPRSVQKRRQGSLSRHTELGEGTPRLWGTFAFLWQRFCLSSGEFSGDLISSFFRRCPQPRWALPPAVRWWPRLSFLIKGGGFRTQDHCWSDWHAPLPVTLPLSSSMTRPTASRSPRRCPDSSLSVSAVVASLHNTCVDSLTHHFNQAEAGLCQP